MARRVPEHVRVELPLRAQAGAGLDHDCPTQGPDGRLIKAKATYQAQPCADATRMAYAIRAHLEEAGAEAVRFLTDLRHYGDTGVITVVWSGAPSAHEVAERFAVTHVDGLPILPGWIGLKAEDDFDLRWQSPY